ncbi:MAG: nuclear transport factor 2 family protein [Propionibacteriaceae bacterium]|nr:nuclear transport factor 2 family protein [Propionibacteriaceae bacterium]
MKKNLNTLVALTVATVAIGLVAGCSSASPQTPTAASTTTNASGSATPVSISTSYDNTAELAKKFPIVNATPIKGQLGEKIENRLLNGFENWNRGFDAWKAWGDILYVPESIYNVHGARLTLPEYQRAMNATLSKTAIAMGNFNNMVVNDNWAAIRYDITTTVSGKSMPGSVMEFVQFKDFGAGQGVRVVEGWGGPKDDSFAGMSSFQTDAEKQAQQQALADVVSYKIPATSNLEKKYPVKNPTTDNSANAKAMKDAVLEDFDAWNQGYDAWAKEASGFYTAGAELAASDGTTQTLDQYTAAAKAAGQTSKVQKVYFENLLVSGDWVAIHYRTTTENLSTQEKTAGDSMQFFHFVKDGDSMKVDKSWTK